MADQALPTTSVRPSLIRQVGDFLADLFRIVLYRPVRYGTLDLSAHSRGVAGIAVAVSIIYAITVASILAANPLRASFELQTALKPSGNIVVPAFLVPGALCLLGVSFALLLSGTQRSPWWQRILYFIAVNGILGCVTAICVTTGVRGALTWVCCGLMALVLIYTVAVWTGKTAASIDAFVFAVLCCGLLLTAFRAIVSQNLQAQTSGELITVSLVLQFVATLALPVAFLSGVNATAFGVSIISWAGEEFGQRVGVLWGALAAAVILAWQWFSLLQDVLMTPGALTGRGSAFVAAIVVVAACIAVWWACHRFVDERERSPVVVAASALKLAVPVSFGLNAAAIIGSLLGLVAIPLASLVNAETVKPMSLAIDIAGSNTFVVATRVAVVVGMAVAAVVLVRSRRILLAAMAAVDAVVLGSFFWQGRVLLGWLWTPSSIGDVGLLAATVLLVIWTVRQTLDRDRVALLVLLALLSALVRKADFFAVPVGFLIGASAAALLIVGLVWGFLTDGGSAHVDQSNFPRDRQLLVVLGTFLFGITIVAWAVIGKDVGTALVLSGETLVAVQTLGTALIISVVLAYAFPRIARPAEAVEAATVDRSGTEVSPDVGPVQS